LWRRYYCSYNTKLVDNETNLLKMATQKVLIAGATGFLGTKITNAFLQKKEFDVLVLARKPSERTAEFVSKGAKIVEGDLSDVESLKKVVNILTKFNFI